MSLPSGHRSRHGKHSGCLIERAVTNDVLLHLFKQAANRARQSHPFRDGGASASLSCSKLMCRHALKTSDDVAQWLQKQPNEEQLNDEQRQENVDVRRCDATGFYCGRQVPRSEKSGVPVLTTTPRVDTPTLAQLTGVEQEAKMLSTIEKLPHTSRQEKERVRTEYLASQADLRKTVQNMNVDAHIAHFAQVVLHFFRFLWEEVQEIIGGWMSDPAQSETAAATIVSDAQRDEKGWLSFVKRGSKSVGSVLQQYVWPAIKAVGSALWSAAKTLGTIGVTMGLWILQNPAMAKMALILGVHYRNVFCRQLGDWYYARPTDAVTNQLVTFDLTKDILAGGASGVVREFAKSSWFDAAFDVVSQRSGSLLSSVVKGLPFVGGMLGAAVEVSTEVITGVTKEAVREATVFYTFQSDVTGSTTLLMDFINPRKCWDKIQERYETVPPPPAPAPLPAPIPPLVDPSSPSGSAGEKRDAGRSRRRRRHRAHRIGERAHRHRHRHQHHRRTRLYRRPPTTLLYYY